MRKLTTSVGDVLLNLNNIILFEINYTHKSKFSIILKYLKFEIVTYEILDFEDHKYEEIDQFS